MPQLQEQVRGYLQSAGFRILEQKADFILADKLVFGQERDTWLVWTVPERADPKSHESALRGSIATIRPNYPDAKAFVLAPSRGGFSRDALHGFAESRVKFLVPAWFFDAPFKVEESPKAASAIADIRALAASSLRIPQPFTTEGPNEGDNSDLFEHLASELPSPVVPTVRVVVGRAGIGKSILFRALFDQLYRGFLDAKQQQRPATRPIPLLPEHLRGAYVLRTEALIENFLRSDVAAPVGKETFEWLLVNGHAGWLLDGLDELYAGDPGFFEYLSDLVTRRESRAQITIFCRDSVLTTSDAFAEFRELCGQGGALEVYHLSDWNRESKKQFAWLRLGGRLSKPGEHPPEHVAGFLDAINRTQTLQALSGLPFYCDLLAAQFEAGRMGDFADDVALLNYVIDEMLVREQKKGLLDLNLLEPDGLMDWLEQIALDYVEGQRYADISRDAALEYGQIVLKQGLSEAERVHMLTSLLQFPLFRAGDMTGKVAFTHDLIAEALAARAYLRLLAKQARQTVGRLSSRLDRDDPTLLRFIAGRLDEETRHVLEQELRQGNLPSRGLPVILSLLLLTDPDRSLIRRLGPSLEAQDLTRLDFADRDLSGVSFRRADLSHVTFRRCDLREAQFEGARLYRTGFDEASTLTGAQFGDRARVESVWVGKHLLETPEELRVWAQEVTGVPDPGGEACGTAQQFLHLFGKYVSPLGEPRRDLLGRRGLLAGKRYGRAAATEACLDEAVRTGYLTGPDFRERYRRAEGDKYAEMVAFVRDWEISDGIGRMIAGLCQQRACLHRARAGEG